MNRTVGYACALLCLFGGLSASKPAGAESGSERVSFSALAAARVGIETGDGRDQVTEFLFTPEIEAVLGRGWQFTGIARFRVDGSDNLEPGQPTEVNRASISHRLFWGDDVDVELREFYVGGPVGDAYVRLGKQQVVWGEADGLKVLDVVNPQSFREFILPEFDDSRIPLWSLSAELPLNDDVSLEVVWVPDETYHDIPDTDSAFALTSPRFVPQAVPGVPVTVFEADKPNDFFADSDAGARLTAFVGGWQFSLNYFYHYLDIPVLRRSVGAGVVSVIPEYERSHLIGGSFNNAFGDFVLRGEVVYLTDEYFLTSDRRDADGIHASGEVSYVIGLDWTGLRDTFISGQVFQSVMLDHAPGVVQDQVDSIATLYIRRSFANARFHASSLLIQSINDGDGVVEAEITWEWRSNIELFLGADIFYGKKKGVFGEFGRRDRIRFGVEVGF
ncbi:MAG: DUF1302 family protein [Gammaproteobacteria bacterium]